MVSSLHMLSLEHMQLSNHKMTLTYKIDKGTPWTHQTFVVKSKPTGPIVVENYQNKKQEEFLTTSYLTPKRKRRHRPNVVSLCGWLLIIDVGQRIA